MAANVRVLSTFHGQARVDENAARVLSHALGQQVLEGRLTQEQAEAAMADVGWAFDEESELVRLRGRLSFRIEVVVEGDVEDLKHVTTDVEGMLLDLKNDDGRGEYDIDSVEVSFFDEEQSW